MVRLVPSSCVALALVALALFALGCSDETSSEDSLPTGPCPAGQWEDEGGTCVPAGLPPNLLCPPGQWQEPGGFCVAAGLPPDMACPPGELELSDGSCQAAGLPPDMACPPGELELSDGSCQAAGVPPEACAAGFVADGQQGCEPTLPASPCPAGWMAVPGDATCVEVAPCGTGTWGDIPVTVSSEHVDKSYTGGNSDGSPQQPWTTIADGYAAAGAGAIVAIAAGSYAEELVIDGKAVRLWGRCPGQVEVVGSTEDGATITIGPGADGTEVRDLAITGVARGLRVAGAQNVLGEGLWVHDCAQAGAVLNDTAGAGSLAIAQSLIEENTSFGLVATGGALTVEATVVRHTLLTAEENAIAIGVAAYESSTEGPATLVLRGSVVETTEGIGVLPQGSAATVEGSVLRGTLPNAEGNFGRAISAQRAPSGTPATLTLRSSLIDDNQDLGVAMLGGEATVEATVVRNTKAHSGGYFGHGLHMQEHQAVTASQLTVSSSLIEHNRMIGICANGAEVTVTGTVVRDTVVAPPGAGSAGIAVVETPGTLAPPRVSVSSSVILDSADVGIWLAGMEATIEGTVVRDVAADAVGEGGWGIGFISLDEPHEPWPSLVRSSIVEGCHKGGVVLAGSPVTLASSVIRGIDLNPGSNYAAAIIAVAHTDYFLPATLTARSVLMEDNRDIGVFVSASEATIEGSVVRGTLLNASGTGGLGALVQCDPVNLAPATATIQSSLFEDNHRIGIGVVGAEATVAASVVQDTQPDPDGQDGWGMSAQYYWSEQEGAGAGASLVLRSSQIERNHTYGVVVVGSEATLLGSVVRDTQLEGQGLKGRGVHVQPSEDGAVSSVVTVDGSLLQGNAQVGLLVLGSEVTIDGSIVADTLANQLESYGAGIVAQTFPDTGAPATLTLRSSLVEGNHEAGVLLWGSEATIETSVIRDTLANAAGNNGRGVAVQYDPASAAPGSVTLFGTLIEDNHVAGLAVIQGSATVDRCVVRATETDSDGLFGDGIMLAAGSGPADATLGFSRVEQSARAGIASFGGEVALGDSLLRCQSLDLNGELYQDRPFRFDDLGGNGCGCPDASGSCSVVSSSLQPPAPVGGLE